MKTRALGRRPRPLGSEQVRLREQRAPPSPPLAAARAAHGEPREGEGTSASPVQMEPDVNPQDEKQHRKSTMRRSTQVQREDIDGPPATFKPLCPAKPSPSFLELPSTHWRPSPGQPYTQTARTGKGKRHFSPDHQPQECFGLLECMHNNIQTQTQIAQAQLALLEDMRESMNLLLAKQEKPSEEGIGQPEQRTPKRGASPRPVS
ncbi:TSSK6-activating co-chaperone protein isoform X2 [Hemicordylus capensis]|uniref:TSSK6-activating co-chaperone protein isoform X2 n=1 Tax=Hemicordylus capensis TaxID=884348 RepID=UPI0023027BF5|nr:TSSK6-activating co-chaperone protein isoform X2 [Hemicordylus capensis]